MRYENGLFIVFSDTMVSVWNKLTQSYVDHLPNELLAKEYIQPSNPSIMSEDNFTVLNAELCDLWETWEKVLAVDEGLHGIPSAESFDMLDIVAMDFNTTKGTLRFYVDGQLIFKVVHDAGVFTLRTATDKILRIGEGLTLTNWTKNWRSL